MSQIALDATTVANVNTWLNGAYDEETKAAIRRMQAENPEELNESFYRSLEFGTGGLRGIMGVGTNRMNRYTVAMATQGLANYVKKVFEGEKELRAAISHDSRNHSRELGVMLTASHNPKEYNGYKAYWNDGCQLTAPHDTNVIDEVEKIKQLSDVRWSGGEERIHIVGSEVDEAFMQQIDKNVLHPECIKAHHDLKIVYTPLHGTGIKLIPTMLQRLGFTNVNVVKEQAVPDGNFPTTPSPNPEEHAAMKMAVELAQKIDADIVFASDPDADRVGVAVKKPSGEWMLLNGNQTMSVIIYYLLKEWKEKGKLTGKEFIIKTIVIYY